MISYEAFFDELEKISAITDPMAKVSGLLDPSTVRKLNILGKKLPKAEQKTLTSTLLPWRGMGGQKTWESAIHSTHAGLK